MRLRTAFTSISKSYSVIHQLASGTDCNQCGHNGKVFTREIYKVVSTSLLQLRCAGRHDKLDFFCSFPASSRITNCAWCML